MRKKSLIIIFFKIIYFKNNAIFESTVKLIFNLKNVRGYRILTSTDKIRFTLLKHKYSQNFALTKLTKLWVEDQRPDHCTVLYINNKTRGAATGHSPQLSLHSSDTGRFSRQISENVYKFLIKCNSPSRIVVRKWHLETRQW